MSDPLTAPGAAVTGADQPPPEVAPVAAPNPAPQQADPSAGFQPQTVTQPPVNNGSAFAPGEQNDEGPSRWGTFVEKLKAGSMDSPVGFYPGYEGAILRAKTQNQMEADFAAANRTKISADDANKMYPGLPKPFTEPQYPEIADLINSDNDRRKSLQAWMNRGPGSGFGMDLAAGAVAGALDPLNASMMAATGGIGSSVAGVFAKNLAINLGTAAFTYPQLQKERRDVSIGGEALNALGGAVVGTGLHVALSAAIDKAANFAKRMSGTSQERNLQAAISQHETGSQIDMSPAVEESQLRSAGAVNPGGVENPYVFNPIDHPSGRTYYTARSAEGNQPIEFNDFGPGLHAVDNGVVANNMAASPESIYTGTVHEIRAPEGANFLDLEQPLPKPLADQALAELRKQGVGPELIADQHIESAPAKDAIQMLRGLESDPGEPSASETMRARVQAEGFDGYKYVENTDGAQHNGIVLFDESKADIGKSFEANKEIVPRMSGPEAQAASDRAQSPESSRLNEPELDQRIEELKTQAPDGVDEAAEDPYTQDQAERAKSVLRAAAEADPTLLEDPEFKALMHQETQDKQEIQLLKDFADCMAGDFT